MPKHAKAFLTAFALLPLALAAAPEPAKHLVDSRAAAEAALKKDWTAPEPVRSARATKKRKAPAGRPSYGVATRALPENPAARDLTGLAAFAEPLRPLPGTSSQAERRALANALRQYLDKGDSAATDPLVRFVDKHPDSRWTPAVLLNLGHIAYDTGYFSDALDFWHRAWQTTKANPDPVATGIANRAVAEYAKMNARVGRRDVLVPLFEEIEGRAFMGDAAVNIASARRGLWAMRNKPGEAYRCGPYALTNIAPALDASADPATLRTFIESVESPDTGFSLPEVLAMAEDELGMDLQMARRAPGAPVLLPAVVHWKVGHYGALTRELNGKYLLEDPTFGNHTWLSADALDAESSGYFLVPAGELPEGWHAATPAEAAGIYGKGHSGDGGENETAKCDHKSGGDDCGQSLAMATYSFHTLLASLSVTDTPVGYPAAYGPDVRLNVTYNQREQGQPGFMPFTNFSPQWVSNWVSWLEDDPSSPGADVTLYQRGGGNETFTDFDPATQRYAIDPQSKAVLEKLGPHSYRKIFSDGAVHYYEHYLGTVGTDRRVFLSRVVDPQGNEVLLEYDPAVTDGARIKYIHDATGLTTEFHYAHPWNDYLVTSVDDPYGRSATFTYESVGGVVRLTAIEDVYGIVSAFQYDATGGITRLDTPYGSTWFELSDFNLSTGGFDLIRYIEATDAYGDKERVEYNLDDAQTGLPPTIDETLPDPALVDYKTGDNDDRNSFYWDKQQMEYGAGDYSKAHLYHWANEKGATDSATSTLESEKPPLEGRIWYNYPGQPDADEAGDLARPSVVARVVEDETGTLATRATRREYNALGNVTQIVDPAGRETLVEYAANGIDVLAVKQRVADSGGQPVYEPLAQYTYNGNDPAHRPRTHTDASGSTTTYTYRPTGQIETITNDLGETITFTYETNVNNDGYGRVTAITGDVPGGDTTFTYDSFDRVRTVTDSEGHTLTYDYDALDRVTVVTYPDGSYEQYDYENHSLVAVRDREGRWSRTFYNALGQPVLQIDPHGQTTQYEWCRCGDIRKLINGEGHVTQWIRDIQGRVTSKEFADGTSTDFSYHPFSGRLHTVTDALNQVATHNYYLDGNLAEVDYSEGDTPDESFTYDPFYNRIATMQDGVGSTAYHYHPNDGATAGAGLLARVNGPFADDTLKYAYDALARLQKRQIVDDATHGIPSYTEEYVFDSQSRVEDVINDLGTFDYSYVGQSERIDAVDYPNGMKTEYTYEDATGDHLLQQIKHLDASATPAVISQFDYTYRQDRNIDTWTTLQNSDPAKKWTFAYDDADRLTGAVRTDTTTQTVLEDYGYGYDKAGNRTVLTDGSTTTHYPANDLNQTTAKQGFGPTRFSGTLDEPATVTVNGQSAQVTSDGGSAPYTFEALVDLAEGENTVTVEATDGNANVTTQSYSVTVGGVEKTLEYDLNGNLRFEKDASGAVLREFQWDAKNRLLKIIDGTHETEFVYDGMDRRARIIERENGVEQSNHVYVWDSAQIAQRRAANGSTAQRNYFATGFTEGGNAYFYTRDHLGSVREVVASDGTTVEAVYDYSPWGEVTKIDGTGVESDFLYTGHFYHSESDLHLALYRAYDPALGMWLSRDPIDRIGSRVPELLPEGPGLYTYAANSPVNNVDLFGLEVRCYASPAFGNDDLNHLFFYSDQPGVGGVGRNGSSGKAHDDGVPDGFDPSSTNFPSTKVELPPGMTDEAFISGVRNDPLLNSGIYLPFIDDCHSSAVRTAHRQGVEALQRPRGRTGSEIPPPNIRPPSRETDLPDLTICFVAGTQITMSDGTTKSIEDIQPGDSVQSWSEESKKLVTGRVLETFDPLHEDLVILDFGERVTKNTEDHPFFVKGKGWCSVSPRLTKSRYPVFKNVDVGQLEVGDECFLLKGSKLFPISLKSIFPTKGLVQTYNLNVDQTSTYFANGILVHNK